MLPLVQGEEACCTSNSESVWAAVQLHSSLLTPCGQPKDTTWEAVWPYNDPPVAAWFQRVWHKDKDAYRMNFIVQHLSGWCQFHPSRGGFRKLMALIFPNKEVRLRVIDNHENVLKKVLHLDDESQCTLAAT